MWRYLVRRILIAIPLLLLVSLVMFFILHLVPGGPLSVYAHGQITPEAMAAIKKNLGLDQPLYIQYFRWLGNALQGNFGFSFDTGLPVTTEILTRLGPTLYLMGSTFILVLLISIPIGVISAVKQYSWIDIGVTTLTFIGQALPVFWIGMLLIMFIYKVPNPFTGKPFLPANGMETTGMPFNIWDRISHLILPMITLALAWVSWYTRFLRSSMLDVIHEDYIRTARAKGIKEQVVRYKHALKNAAIPLVTVVTMDLPTLIGGALFVEIIFSWPGMGRLFYSAVERRDYPILMGTIMMSAVLIILSNLLADLIYAYLDPRIRYE